MSNNIGIDFIDFGPSDGTKPGRTVQAAHGSNLGGYETSPIKGTGYSRRKTRRPDKVGIGVKPKGKGNHSGLC